jgi:hypothetical protein
MARGYGIADTTGTFETNFGLVATSLDKTRMTSSFRVIPRVAASALAERTSESGRSLRLTFLGTDSDSLTE